MGSGGGLLTVCQEEGGLRRVRPVRAGLAGFCTGPGPPWPDRPASAPALRPVLAARHLRMRYPGRMHFARLLLT
jgi:hypothetical protein